MINVAENGMATERAQDAQKNMERALPMSPGSLFRRSLFDVLLRSLRVLRVFCGVFCGFHYLDWAAPKLALLTASKFRFILWFNLLSASREARKDRSCHSIYPRFCAHFLAARFAFLLTRSGPFFCRRFVLAPSKTILDNSDIERALKRIAHEIAERNKGTRDVAIVGIRTRGVPLAKRIAAHLTRIEGLAPLEGALDIALHRDDYHLRAAAPKSSQIPFDVSGVTVVLVDDVLFTGRTIRAALDALSDFGRPAGVQLAVLVDRGHRELPIRADYVGKNIPTTKEQTVRVHLSETDSHDEVNIESQPDKTTGNPKFSTC